MLINSAKKLFPVGISAPSNVSEVKLVNSARAERKADSRVVAGVFNEGVEAVKVRLSWVVFEGEIAVKREVRLPDPNVRERMLGRTYFRKGIMWGSGEGAIMES